MFEETERPLKDLRSVNVFPILSKQKSWSWSGFNKITRLGSGFPIHWIWIRNIPINEGHPWNCTSRIWFTGVCLGNKKIKKQSKRGEGVGGLACGLPWRRHRCPWWGPRRRRSCSGYQVPALCPQSRSCTPKDYTLPKSSECLSLRPKHLPPPPLPQASVSSPTLEPKGDGEGWGDGGSQFGRLERKPGTLYTLCSHTHIIE